jgi:hypothetical protein
MGCRTRRLTFTRENDKKAGICWPFCFSSLSSGRSMDGQRSRRTEPVENKHAKTDSFVGKSRGVMAIPGQLPKMAMIRTAMATYGARLSGHG